MKAAIQQPGALSDENELLKKQLAQKEAELAIISSVSEAISKQLNINTITRIIGDKIRDIFNSEVTEILLYDESAKMIHVPYSFYRDYQIAESFPFGEGLTSKVIKSGKPLVHGTYEEAKKLDVIVQSEEEKTETYIGVPIIANNKVIGVVSIQSYRKNDYNDEKVRLLSILSSNMGVALANAKLFEQTKKLLSETEQRTAELTIINSVGEAMSKQLDVNTVTKIVGDKVKEIFKAEVTEILLLNEDSKMISAPYSYYNGYQVVEPFSLGSGLTSKVIKSGKPLLIPNYEEQVKLGAIIDDSIGEADKTETYLGIPIMFNNRILGVVSIQSYQKNAYDENNVRLLSTLSRNMGVTLQNANLFEQTKKLLNETEQRTAELAVINSVQEGLAKELDMDGIYNLVGDRIQNLFNAQVVIIATLDTENKNEHFNYFFENDEKVKAEPRTLGKLRLQLIKTRKKIIINTLEEGIEWFGTQVVAGTKQIKSAVFVPLIIGDKITSYVSLQNIDKEYAFTDSDIRLLETLSNSMSVAIENARLFDETTRLLNETEQRTAELAIINSVQEGLAKELSINGIYELVGEKIREIFNAQVIDIVTYDKKSGMIEDCYSYEKGDRTLLGQRPLKGFRKHVAESAKSLLINKDVEKAMKKYDNVVEIGGVPKSNLFVPMIVGEEVTAIISLQNIDEENAFSESDVRLLTTLANSMSVALQNAKLFEETKRLLNETEQRTAELSVINSVQEGLVAEMDLQGIYELVGDRLRELFDAQVTGIYTFDHENGTEHFRYLFEDGERLYPEPRPLNNIRNWIIKNSSTLLINENADDKMYELTGDKLTTVPGTRLPKSLLFVPLKVGSEVRGCVSLQNLDKENAFLESDVRLLSTLANSMSVALHNANLFEETKRLLSEMKQRNTELGVINSVQEGLVKQIELQAIYDLVGDQIYKIFDAQVVAIASFNHNDKSEIFNYLLEKGQRYYPEIRKYDKVREYLIKNKKLILINEDFEKASKKFGMKVLEGTEMPKSLLFVPLIVGNVVKGYISLQNIDRENAFNESDIRLLTTLTNSMSVALENARLFDETVHLLKETEQRTAELAIINSVGEAMSKQLDVDTVTKIVGDKVREIFNSEVTEILFLNSEKQMIEIPYSYYNGYQTFEPFKLGEGLTSKIINSRKPLLLNNIDDQIKEGAIVQSEEDKTESYMGVPILFGEKVLGVVSIQSYKKNAYDDNNIRLLSTLSTNMGITIQNARLFEETKRLLEESKQQTIELGIINSVGDGLAKQLDFQSIVDLVGDKIREVFNAKVVSVSTYDSVSETIHHRYVVEKDKRFYFENSIEIDSDRKEIIETKRPLIFGSSQQIIEHSGEAVLDGEMPESFMGVPIIHNQKVTGVITVQDLDTQNLYSEKDARLLLTLASNMGVALENARLFEETKRLLNETQQRNVELSILNAIQEGLVMEMDFNSIINLVGDKFREALGFLDLGIRIYDKEKNILHYTYEYEHGKRLNIEPMEPTPLSNYVLESGKMLLLKKATDEEIAKLGITGQTTIPGTDESKSLVFVPIKIGSEVKGLILVEDYEKEDAFSESEIRLLTTVANSMSVALENARLFDETNRLLNETEQRSAELSVINSVQEGLAKELDLKGIYNLVGDRLCSLFPDSQTLVIRSFNHETGLEEWQYAIEKGVRLEVEPRPFTWANKILIETKKPFDIRENYLETAKKYGGKGVTKGKPPKSAVFVPIIIGEIVIGSISLQNIDKENAFNDSDVRLVTTLVNSMTVAIENARLFNETKRLLDESKKRTAELGTVNSISRAIVGHLEIEKLISLVGDKVRDLFNANIVYVALYNKENSLIEFPYVFGDELHPLKLGEGLTSKIILQKTPLLLNEDVGKKTDELGVKLVGTLSASYLGVPIPVGDEIIGVLSVQSTQNENVFNEDDMRLLGTIAAHVGIAINNANAYKELNITLENLQATQNQLIAQEKLASLGQLTAGIAHEIKNPLNFVNNFSELSVQLVDDMGEELDKIKGIDKDILNEINEILGTLKQNSEKIKEHGKRADSIVHSMLQHSRGKTGEKQPTDINAMLNEDINLVYHGMRAQDNAFNITIEKEFDKNIRELNVIPQDISRVFLNVITNGCYEAYRKKVELKTAEPAIIRVKTSESDKYIEIRVRDNGHGIPDKIKDNLFTPFFTTKPTGKGTGLGLSISYDIVVNEHQGELLFETEEGKYTEFIIRIPKNSKH
jgi:GAF domain-containing protein/anti-sigma regulatory factor (Ser/Thr protein kinase)